MPIEAAIRVEIDVSHRDVEIARLAERQHGVVARTQLFALDLGHGAIRHRVKRGWLHAIHRGVYAVGHRALTREGWWMAAVLAAGPGAVLSHRSAAALWRIRSRAGGSIDVTAQRRLRLRPGVETYQRTLPADEVTVRCGIPVTTVSRTLFDLASAAGPHEARRAMHEAEFLRLSDARSLDDLVYRHAGERGAGVIRKIIEDEHIGLAVTRSQLEDRFLAFLDARDLPRPEVNVLVQGVEVDCLWREQRVIVELDGHASHATRATFESDRTRDRRLTVAGLRTIRVTWRHLHQDADGLASDLRALLRPTID
jgi:predicted transcriptional regulator of viral defense system